jgi:hypothetical protein
MSHERRFFVCEATGGDRMTKAVDTLRALRPYFRYVFSPALTRNKTLSTRTLLLPLLLTFIAYVGTLGSTNALGQTSITRQEFVQWVTEYADGSPGDKEMKECYGTGLADAIFEPGETRVDKITLDARIGTLTKDKQKVIALTCILDVKAARERGSSAPRVEMKAVAVSDLILDYRGLVGQKMSVRGFFMAIGDLSFLYEKAGSMTFVTVDSSNLSRDDRKRLLTTCSNGCPVTIEGIVKDINYQKGIIARELRLN